VAYAPSVAAAIRLSGRDEARQTGRSLVVGDPRGNLPHARAEAEAVAEVLDAAPLLGSEATVASVTGALDAADRAHFAAHGHFDPANPLRSGISLADGILRAGELLGRPAAPQTFVVSACESGRQFAGTGDELWGLSRGLLYAGASTVVVSLWRVADRTTKDLMVRFYASLDDDTLPKPRAAHALRAAMIEVRTHHPQTFVWAPFILLGDPQ
jgi:CHAT domain-containing protein